MKKLFLSLFFFISAAYSSGVDFSRNHASWIKRCQDSRIYIETDRILISEEGIFVVDDYNSKLFLTSLESDCFGVYTKIESIKSSSAVVYPIVWCHTCEEYRMIDIKGRCLICGKVP